MTVKTFSILDIEQHVYEQNKLIAINKFKNGEKPKYSTDICDCNTSGYGRIDEYGYFEYPLPMGFNKETKEYEIDLNLIKETKL